MNILVTGADGFIGSHLVESLISQGQKVRALSMYNSFNNWGWLEDVKHVKELEVVSGDIRDAHLCEDITKDVDLIFHLAALIAIPYSYNAPDSFIDTNVRGTLNICQAAIKNGVGRVMHTSTSEVYGTARYTPIDEDHPLQAQSPYSASKIGADAIAISLHNSFDLPLTIVRPFNTFGPRQSARAVIPTIISQIASGAKEIKLGDTSPTRDFSYVEDTCEGFIKLSHSSEAIGETVNIGSNYEISILELAQLIKKLMKSNINLVSDRERFRPESSEVNRLWCDNSKIETLVGFKPQIDIEEGLKRTIKWFLKPKNLKKYKTDIYNV